MLFTTHTDAHTHTHTVRMKVYFSTHRCLPFPTSGPSDRQGTGIKIQSYPAASPFSLPQLRLERAYMHQLQAQKKSTCLVGNCPVSVEQEGSFDHLPFLFLGVAAASVVLKPEPARKDCHMVLWLILYCILCVVACCCVLVAPLPFFVYWLNSHLSHKYLGPCLRNCAGICGY